MELLLELLPDPELGYEGTGTGGAGRGRGSAPVSMGCSAPTLPMSTPRRAQLPARDPPRPRGTQGPGGDLCEGLPSPLQSHCTKSAELEPTPWPLGPLGTTGWRRAEELVAPNLPGWGWQPTGRRRGHGSAETLRGLTLLHSGTGVKEGVMEKLICRRGMGPGSGGVRPGPTVPGALSPLLHSSNGGRQSPSWCPQRGPGPDPATLPTVFPAVLPIAKPGIYLRCWERSCGPREKPLTAATGPLGVGCAGRGGQGRKPEGPDPPGLSAEVAGQPGGAHRSPCGLCGCAEAETGAAVSAGPRSPGGCWGHRARR